MNNKPILFKTNDYEIKSVTRLPNKKEKVQYIQNILKSLYFLKGKIDRDQYKTAMRQCINDEKSVLEFIYKLNNPDIYRDYYRYCNTEHSYLEATTKITFTNPVSVCKIDIDLNK